MIMSACHACLSQCLPQLAPSPNHDAQPPMHAAGDSTPCVGRGGALRPPVLRQRLLLQPRSHPLLPQPGHAPRHRAPSPRSKLPRLQRVPRNASHPPPLRRAGLHVRRLDLHRHDRVQQVVGRKVTSGQRRAGKAQRRVAGGGGGRLRALQDEPGAFGFAGFGGDSACFGHGASKRTSETGGLRRVGHVHGCEQSPL